MPALTVPAHPLGGFGAARMFRRRRWHSIHLFWLTTIRNGVRKRVAFLVHDLSDGPLEGDRYSAWVGSQKFDKTPKAFAGQSCRARWFDSLTRWRYSL
jgi:hypothetical protein